MEAAAKSPNICSAGSELLLAIPEFFFRGQTGETDVLDELICTAERQRASLQCREQWLVIPGTGLRL
jgi:hypothetical protein